MFRKILYEHDWIVSAIVIAILTIGVVTIYSTTVLTASQNDFIRQVIFAITGIFIYFFLSVIDYSYLKYKPVVVIMYIIDILLLLFAFLGGHNIGGAVRWLSVGAVNVQPSETTKLVLIIALSSFLSYTNRHDRIEFLKSIAILIPFAILVFIEPSLSSTIVIIVIWAGIYFVSGANQMKYVLLLLLLFITINLSSALFMPHILFLPVIRGVSIGVAAVSFIIIVGIYLSRLMTLRIFLIVLLIGLVLGVGGKYIVWNKVLKPYQKARITAFSTQLNNSQTNNPQAFQLQQSRIAIGSGEILGKGFAQGTQSALDFLPDHNTDFIFASFSEEFGLLGDSILIGLFAILFFRLIYIAEHVEDRFGFLLITGIITMLIFQTFINIAINIGLLPSTGIPMPLVSYGGSSLWVTLSLLGIAQSIYKQSHSKKWLSLGI